MHTSLVEKLNKIEHPILKFYIKQALKLKKNNTRDATKYAFAKQTRIIPRSSPVLTKFAKTT